MISGRPRKRIENRRGSRDAKSKAEMILGKPLSFGNAVEALRFREGISKAAFAKRIGVSRQYLSDVEKGRRQARPGQVARFARAFGHPPEVLIELALQDSVNATGLKMKVIVKAG